MRELTASQRVASLHMAKMQKEGFFLESIKEKLVLGTLTTEAKAQSKMMSSDAKKGMRMLFGDAGINSPEKFAAFVKSGKADLKDPFSKILFKACKGKSVGETGDIAGRFFSAYYKKDIKGMAKAAAFDEKAMQLVCIHYVKDTSSFKSTTRKGEKELSKALHKRLGEYAELYVKQEHPTIKLSKVGALGAVAALTVAAENKDGFWVFLKGAYKLKDDISGLIDYILHHLTYDVIGEALDKSTKGIVITHPIAAGVMETFFGFVGIVSASTEWVLGKVASFLGWVFCCLVDTETGSMALVWSTLRELLQSGWAIIKYGIIACFLVLEKAFVTSAGVLGGAFVLKVLALGAVAYFVWLFMAWGNYKLAELPKMIFIDIPIWIVRKLWALVTGGKYTLEPRSQKALEQEVDKTRDEIKKIKPKVPKKDRMKSRFKRKAVSF